MHDMASQQEYIRSLRGPILVTGASGFVGANLFHLIQATRDDVFAVVRREKGWRLAQVRDERVVAADLNDRSAVKNLVQNIEPQTIFHCAAYGAYAFETDSELIMQTNLQALVNLVDLLTRRQISAFVHAGSSSEYGTNCAGPAEEDSCEPNSTYAVSKLAAAQFLTYMGRHHGFPCLNLRLYSVYGPLEDTSRLIPNMVRQALQGALPPLVDARTSRDFVYVGDVCAAFILAAARMHPGLYGTSLNIGTGRKTTIGELVDVVRSQFDIAQEPRFGALEGRAWDLADWYANPARAREVLAWVPATSLQEGLAATSQWVSRLTDLEMSTLTKKTSRARPRSLSAIVACYKDELAIPIMHRRLTETFLKLGIDYEIIFVNDGSPDDSARVIRDISEHDPHTLGITHSRNFGSQMAFRSGMELATKQGVVLLDGDLQDPPELIEQFHSRWEEGWDVVYGRRVKRDMRWHTELTYKAFYRVFALFSYVPIPLDAGDFSLMDRRVVMWLLNSTERDLFLRGLRAFVGFRQTGVDYVRPERMFGVSTNNFFRNVEWAKRGIFSFSNAPLTLLTTLGVWLLGLSTLLAIVAAALRIFVPDIAPRGITTVVVLVLMFGSLNLFAVGLVGEYVAKIMIEVKGRPRLIRSALIRHGKTTALLPDGKAY